LWSRVINYQCKGDKNKNEEKHVGAGVALHGEVDIERRTEDDEDDDKREDRARPDKNEDTKEDEE
jgi:hypothetical protein